LNYSECIEEKCTVGEGKAGKVKLYGRIIESFYC
jgi:hypothetical protein